MKASLEVVVVPVADVDRAKSFYEHTLSFVVDHDAITPDGRRLVQLLATDGLEVFDRTGLRPAREGDRLDFVGFVRFRDPDGNGWIVQQLMRPEADA